MMTKLNSGRTVITMTMLLTAAAGIWSVIALDGTARIVAAAFAVALMLLLIWLLRTSVLPVIRIVSGMDLLRSQDFASRLRAVGQYDADRLAATFNTMMDALHRERTRLSEQNYYLSLLVEASPMGVVNYDLDGRISTLNRSAMKLLSLRSQEDARGLTPDTLPGEAGKALRGLADGETRTVTIGGIIMGVTLAHYIDRGAERRFMLLVKLDEEMRRAERHGYTTAIRTMAHEIGNTTGAVGSSLQTVTDIVSSSDIPLEERKDISELIEASQGRMANMRRFIESFATLARLPEPTLVVTDIAGLVERAEPALRAICSKAGVTLIADVKRGRFIDRADPSQLEQVLINLVKNSVESIAASGRSDGTVTIGVTANTFYVTDNGTGISDSDAAQALSNPFFTTKPGGQGIGLTLTCDIIRAHHWRSTLATDKDTGLTSFTIIRD